MRRELLVDEAPPAPNEAPNTKESLFSPELKKLYDTVCRVFTEQLGESVSDDLELSAAASGSEAAKLGAKVYQNHLKQLNQANSGLALAEGYCAPSVDYFLEFDWIQRKMFPYQKYDSAKGQDLDLKLPVTVRDKIYLIVSQEHGLSIFVSHEDCVEPNPYLYQEIANNELDPNWVLRHIFYQLSRTGSRQTQLLQRHQAQAVEYDLEINPTQFADFKTYSNRMHCYLSGWKDGEFYQAISEVLAKLRHDQCLSEGKDEFLWTQLKNLDEASLMSLLRIDVSPFYSRDMAGILLAIVQVFCLESLEIATADDFGPDLRAFQQSLPVVSEDLKARFVYHALIKIITHRGSRRVNLSLFPSLKLENRVLFMGLLEVALNCKELLQSCHALVDFVGAEIADSEQIEILHQLVELYQKSTRLSTEENIICGTDARELLKLDRVEGALHHFSPRSETWQPYTSYGKPYDFNRDLGIRRQRLPLPISDYKPPQLPKLELGVVERGYGRDLVRLRHDKPVLPLLTDRGVEWVTATDKNVFKELAEYCQHPWVAGQFNPDEIEVLSLIFMHLDRELAAFLRENPLHPDREVAAFVQESVRTRLPMARGFNELLQRFTESLVSAYDYDQAARYLVRFYPGLSMHRLVESSPKLALESSHYPFDLSLIRAEKLNRVETKIRNFLKKAENQQQYDCQYKHLGLRLLGFLRGLQVHCSDFETGQGETVWYDWAFSKKSQDLVANFWQDSDYSDKDISDDALMRDLDFCQNLGIEFCRWSRQQSQQLWDDYLSAAANDKRLSCLRSIRDYYYAVYEIFQLRTTLKSGYGFWYGTTQGLFSTLNMHRNLDQLIELVEAEVYPISPLSIDLNQPLVLLGENEAGKSSILRAAANSLILARQQLPQLGEASLSQIETMHSVVGVEKQIWNGSLFTQMVPALNKITQAESDDKQVESRLWLMDELGRRTNRSYGLAIFMTAMVLASDHESLFAGATHYHDLPLYLDFFNNLDMNPDFRVVADYDHRELKPGEKIESQVIATLSQVFSTDELAGWPEEDELKEAAGERTHPPQLSELEPAEALAQTKKDVMGEKEERVNLLQRLFLVNSDLAALIDSQLLNFEQAEQKQALLKAVLNHPKYSQWKEIVANVVEIHHFFLNLRRQGLNGIEKNEAAFRFFQGLFDIKNPQTKAAVKQEISQAKKFLQGQFDQLLHEFRPILEEAHPNLLSLDRIPNGLVEAPAGVKKVYDLFLLGAVFAYADFISTQEAVEVEFTKEPVIQIRQAVNPVLYEPVPNDIDLNLAGDKCGTVITGENGSGKSNFLLTIPWMLTLGLSTGYVPAESAKINRDVIPVSLVQPVADTLAVSSMRMEAEARIKLAIRGLKLAESHEGYILTLLDEPGAPTSQTDATKLIRWLISKYQQADNAHLAVTTHCDNLDNYLGEQVDYLAFKLLSNTPYVPFQGIGDSNALEVAKSVGLNEEFYQVSLAIHEMIVQIDTIKANDQQTSSEEIEQIFAKCAGQVKTILDND